MVVVQPRPGFDAQTAAPVVEDASAADPNLGMANLNQGIALSSLGKVDEAKVLLERAAKTSPKDPHVWYALGMLDKNSSNPEAAVEDFKRVIELDDTDAEDSEIERVVITKRTKVTRVSS